MRLHLAAFGQGLLSQVARAGLSVTPLRQNFSRCRCTSDYLYKVMTLVYRLVFVHIGYEGVFAVRSSRSWPEATFSGKKVRSTLAK